MSTTLIKGGTVISATEEKATNVLLEEGVVKEIGSIESGDEIIDATGKLLMPGLIDCHVHFREPGFPDKADMQSESASAVAGGVTTVCEMPNTNPPVVTVDAFADKVERAKQIEGCDLRFFFGLTQGNHIEELKALMENDNLRVRCSGVKLYLDHSTGNQKVEGGIVEDIFKTCADLGVTLVAHCEDAEMNTKAADMNVSSDISAHSAMRPAESEATSIEYALEIAAKYDTKFHIAHMSTKQGVGMVSIAKEKGMKVTCEVSPHHLFLSTDDYEHLGTFAKMNPPLRTSDHCGALWQGIMDGVVDCVATDHAPHTLQEKQITPPLSAPSGVPGVETMVPLLLTMVADQPEFANISYQDIVRLCFENPNRIFSLGKKGIATGAPTDIILIDPKKEWEIKGAELHSKCTWTPFEGWNAIGKVIRVLNR